MATLRSSVANLQRNQENNHVSRKATRLTTQRAVLGDIGNRVKAMAISRDEVTLHKPKNNAADKPSVRPNGRKGLIAGKASRVGKPLRVGEKTVTHQDVKPMDISMQEEVEEAFSAKLLQVEDIDKDDHDKPQLVSHCVKDIYDYLRHMEAKLCVKEQYLLGHSLITPKNREVLIDWLIQVHLRFRLLPETLYLTVDIIDRFLQDDQSVKRSELQLVGVAAMFIASKYEEIYAPEIEDFVYITDKTYDAPTIRKMERRILSGLDFNLGRPLPVHFLRRNSKAGQVDAKEHTLAKYLMELTLPEYSIRHYKPSMVAAAALYLSLRLLTPEWTSKTWDDVLVHYSSYTESQIKPLVKKMAVLVTKVNRKRGQSNSDNEKNRLMTVAQKYSSSKLMSISTIPELNNKVLAELAGC